MARFIGIKNDKIYIISDKVFDNELYKILEVPAELDGVSAPELISNYRIRDNKIIPKHAKLPASQLKVAFVGNWKMRCGIATYSENLVPEVFKHVGDYKLFIEENDNPTGLLNMMGDDLIPDNKINICWKRGESLQKLASEIKNYNPDVIWLQHEFGIFPNARYWLSLMNQLSGYRVIVTMHSVFHHKDKIICEAAMPEIVVHLDGAKKILKEEKQLASKVYVIPHGCFPCDNKSKLWNFYKTERTFMQFGFGFRYKGWELSIKAVSILKEKYPDIFFTGLFSESEFNKMEHEVYYNELMDEIVALGLQDNVAILRGYQSEETLDAYLRTNRATVFPYISHPQHEVFGASGAARIAMSKGIPVITTGVNHFSDLPTIKADTPEEIAAQLEILFLDPKARSAQVEKQCAYLDENTWEKIGLQYVKIFES